MKTAKRKTQERLVIFAGMAIVVLSVLLTVVTQKMMDRKSQKATGYVNITFTDAMHTCENAIERQFADRLLSKVLDSHSSRYSQRDFEYKLFFNLYTRPAQVHLKPNAFYVSCAVHSEKGRIARFDVAEVVEVDESAGQAIRQQDTNPFGFPR